MKYNPNRKGMAEYLVSEDMKQVLAPVAQKALRTAQALISKPNAPEATGGTAATGRIEYEVRSVVKGSPRVVASVVFGGHAVEAQFGNRRTKPNRFLTRTRDML